MPGLGEECYQSLFSTYCADGLICEDRICNRAAFPDDPCDDDDTTCAHSACIEGVCELLAGFGEACDGDDDCSSGRCDNNTCVDIEGCIP